jgi:MFS family permease
MSVMVLGVMIFGVYLVPLAEATGAGLVGASLYMTIYGWVMAAAAIVYGHLYAKFKSQQAFRTLNVLVCVLGAASPLWNGTIAPMFGIFGYYIGATINGLSGGCLMAMVPLMMITNWFGPKFRGKFMGMASAAAIFGGVVWPPLFTWILQNVGMDMTYIANAAVLFVFSGIPTIFIFRKRDEDVLPWGVKSWDELQAQEGGDASKYGYPPKKIFKSVAFYLVVCSTICFTIHGSMAQNGVGAPTYWLSYDPTINGPMIAAIGMSIGTVGEACWKVLSGFVIDKFGPAINNAIFTGIAVFGMFVMVLGPKIVPVIYAGGIFFSAATVPIILGGPMLMSALFGPRTFPIVQGYISAVNTFLSGLTSPLMAMLILGVGYTTAFGIGASIWLIPIVIALVIAFKFLGKMQWEDEDGNPMPKATEADKAA